MENTKKEMKMDNVMNTLEYRAETVVTGEGGYMIDDQGVKHLDFYADTGASGLGYNHPQTRKVFKRALDEGILVHSLNLHPNRELLDGSKMLCEKTGMDKAFFCNSGTEAVEACIKLARLYQHKNSDRTAEIWSQRGGFHGRSYGSLTASDGPVYHFDGFGPFLSDFHKWSWDNIEAINPNAAAVLLSPVLGRHDIEVYSRDQLLSLREYCDKHGILLIFDEVQSGSGRSGSYLYAQKVGVMPDIVALGKGVALGFPMGVCLAPKHIADAFTPGSHFSTFGGSPLACAFLKGALEYMDDDFLEAVDAKGEYLVDRLSKCSHVQRVAGVGLLRAVYADFDAMEFSRRCAARNLIIGAWRPSPIRVTPVADIDYDTLDLGISTMIEVFEEMSR